MFPQDGVFPWVEGVEIEHADVHTHSETKIDFKISPSAVGRIPKCVCYGVDDEEEVLHEGSVKTETEMFPALHISQWEDAFFLWV